MYLDELPEGQDFIADGTGQRGTLLRINEGSATVRWHGAKHVVVETRAGTRAEFDRRLAVQTVTRRMVVHELPTRTPMPEPRRRGAKAPKPKLTCAACHTPFVHTKRGRKPSLCPRCKP